MIYISTRILYIFFFFFNDTATTEIYTLSLHDALPISSIPPRSRCRRAWRSTERRRGPTCRRSSPKSRRRSEEHTSELQSQSNLVCRLLLEKKKKHRSIHRIRVYRAPHRFLATS